MKRRDFIKLGAATFVPGGRANAEEEVIPQQPESASTTPAPETPASAPVARVKTEEARPLPKNDPLFSDIDQHIKFKVEELAKHLRSKKHEDWRLVAYTDPAHKPEAPIYDIGAGFNLSIPTDRVRGEEGDRYQFHRKRIEPSSRRLWESAGLNPDKFDAVIQRVQERVKQFGHDYRKNFPLFKELHEDPRHHDISEEEAEKLLMISIRHAAHNAMAYAKDFPSMTKHQQMAMTAMVYQIGANLEQFEKTLAAMNDTTKLDQLKASNAPQREIMRAERAHWQNVATLFSQSDWARKHKSRAARVLDWLDPQYGESKSFTERVRSWTERQKPANTHSRSSR